MREARGAFCEEAALAEPVRSPASAVSPAQAVEKEPVRKSEPFWRPSASSSSTRTAAAPACGAEVATEERITGARPQESKYPKRWLSVGMTFLASLIAWGATVAAMTFVRNHMA